MREDEAMPAEEQNDEYPTKRTAGDLAHLGARSFLAGASGIPGAGFLTGPALEFFNYFVAQPIDDRRQAFFIRLNDRLLEVQGEIEELQTERLANNPAFQSALLTAVMFSIKTHQEGKLEALAWATLNSALAIDPDGTREAMFMRWIDEMTPHHLRLVKVLNDPTSLVNTVDPSAEIGEIPTFRDVFSNYMPELMNMEELGLRIVVELKARGLIEYSQRVGTDSIDFPAAHDGKGGTALGRMFIHFIESPIEREAGSEGHQ